MRKAAKQPAVRRQVPLAPRSRTGGRRVDSSVCAAAEADTIANTHPVATHEIGLLVDIAVLLLFSNREFLAEVGDSDALVVGLKRRATNVGDSLRRSASAAVVVTQVDEGAADLTAR